VYVFILITPERGKSCYSGKTVTKKINLSTIDASPTPYLGLSI